MRRPKTPKHPRTHPSQHLQNPRSLRYPQYPARAPITSKQRRQLRRRSRVSRLLGTLATIILSLTYCVLMAWSLTATVHILNTTFPLALIMLPGTFICMLIAGAIALFRSLQ